MSHPVFISFLLIILLNTDNVIHPNYNNDVNGFANLIIDKSVKNPLEYKGIYQGYFGQSAIEISLEEVDENGGVSGYSLHKGLKRPLNGSWEWVSNSNKAKFILHEPGDNKFDGHFEIQIDSKTFEGEGTWYPKPNSGLGEVLVTIKKQ